MANGKVLIIDDSSLVRNYLSKMITSTSNLELCGAASNGESGVKMILEHHPDIVILDLEMDQGNGLFVLDQIKSLMSPLDHPFVLIHSSRAKPGDQMLKQAIDFGFCDFILKIESEPETFFEALNNAFIPKINFGLDAKHSRSLLKNITKKPSATSSQASVVTPVSVVQKIPSGLAHLNQVINNKYILPSLIVIGASTGGPQAVRALLTNLPRNITVPIIVIQHMPETFTLSFAQELERASGLPTIELKHNTRLENGKIHVFPGGMHGRLNLFGNLFVYYAEKQEFEGHPFKPSINFAINSLVGSLHHHVIYFILSGMGKDGATGATQLHNKGSLVIAQDKHSSAVWGMPQAAIQTGNVDVILSQNELNEGLKTILQKYGI